ncbi:MAG: hypothetical protein IT270_16805 [Saprospiraceae bacterium]|nr:hypothetical protein [Saprospiraceae bacterium]
MKNALFPIVMLALFLVAGCCKPPDDMPCDSSQVVTLKDFTGLDGCGFVLILADSTVLEPTNLNAFVSTPSDGQSVSVTFHEVNTFSICMVGPMVEIDCLEVVPE